jgi:hypothetical protein
MAAISDAHACSGRRAPSCASGWDVRRLERDNESWNFLETAPTGSGFAKTDA